MLPPFFKEDLKVEVMSQLKLLVIHCTDTPKGRAITSAQIRSWHTDPKPRGNGWRQVGYSDMIHLNGMIENLVPYNSNDVVESWEVTNGAAGYNNQARHVVYVGGKTEDGKYSADTRTAAQRMTLANYVKQTIAQHPDIKVCGHNQLTTAKRCPSFDVPMWLKAIGINPKNILL